MAANYSPEFVKATFDKVAWRLIPFLFICYIVAFLDRVNVGFAKLQMAPDLQFSDAVYGFGAGVFFIGYFIFEVPSNVILERVGARVWIARIMITWGIISSAFMFTHHFHWGPVAGWFNLTDAEFTFYFLRFLLGVAEAGFFPGIILYLTYWFPGPRRAKMVALFMTAIAISNVIGSPVSGAIMQYMDGANGWRGWQWLFLLEGIPSVLIGALVFVLLPNGPKSARWLTEREKDMVLHLVAEDDNAKKDLGQRHSFIDAFRDLRVWALSVVYFCGVVGFYAVNFWMPTIISELGIQKNDFLKVGLLSMIPWGVAAVSMVLWGAHSDRTAERRWHAAGGLLVAMAGLLALTAVGHAPIPSIIALTLVTAGILSWVATFWSLPTAFLSSTAAAAGIAWINSVGNLGGHFGPDLIGRIRTATGGHTEAAFYALAGVALLGALIIILLPRTQRAPAAAAGAGVPQR
ncbi:MAG TPA: MFS transporter [Burkholderiales bacterium]|nr:MFS transporter [Burkholderiales bacterium]